MRHGWLLCLLLMPTVWAEESVPSRPCLVAAPTMTAALPTGEPIVAILVLPCENILEKNAAWQDWEQEWTTRYRLGLDQESPKAD